MQCIYLNLFIVNNSFTIIIHVLLFLYNPSWFVHEGDLEQLNKYNLNIFSTKYNIWTIPLENNNFGQGLPIVLLSTTIQSESLVETKL